MAFINKIQTILRKSNGDIINFYVKDNVLYYREFSNCLGWKKEISLFDNVIHNQIDIKIDENDEVFGIAKREDGELRYIYSINNRITSKKLFDYEDDIYIIKYPQIVKDKSDIHLIYYIKHIHGISSWGLVHNFFDGKEWHQNTITIIDTNKIINPFTIYESNDGLGIYYFHLVQGNEEIFHTLFNYRKKSWLEPTQITDTRNNKLYLNSLIDGNIHHLTWSEYINNNLVVKHLRLSIKDNTKTLASLSEPLNCSFPLFVKTNNVLWLIWTQTDKILSCYSLDNGLNWSKPAITIESTINFIRYRFYSNYNQEKSKFKLRETFGTYNPRISFIGFKNITN